MLENKRLVVTGALGNLGRAVYDLASSYGATVFAIDIIASEALPRYYQTDLCNAELTAATLKEIGTVDALINIAGGFDMGEDSWSTDDAAWHHLREINFDTTRNTIKAIVPQFIRQGHGNIVNVGALAAQNGAAKMNAYCVSKNAVHLLTQSLAEELKDNKINVNAVLPSILDTPANRAAMPHADFNKWIKPEALANIICFLASDSASAINGALIPIKSYG